MTWMELFILLDGMVKAKHTSLCDTPSQVVTVVVDDIEYCIDIVESLTNGKIHFVTILEKNDEV